MELGCVLVISVLSAVVATPHGYGVKGGAVAKAAAISGAFAGVPSIPGLGGAGPGGVALGHSADLGHVVGGDGSLGTTGNGALGGSFTSSGSFSKSSASSFASSSASSYSYSGSGGYSVPASGSVNNGNPAYTAAGANGQAVSNGAYPESGNIQSGSVPGNIGGYAAPVSGNQISSNSAAGAFAGAGSAGYGKPGYNPSSYSPVQDTGSNGNCNSNGGCNENLKPTINSDNINVGGSSVAAAGANTFAASGSNCENGKCGASPTPNKCSSGNCGSNLQTQVPSDNSNDITVNAGKYSSTKTSYDADAQSSLYNNKNPASTAYGGTNCASGNCDTPSESVYNHNVNPQHSVQGSDKCNSNTPGCNYPYNSKPLDGPRPIEKPSTHFTTPKETKPEPCSSGNCGNTDLNQAPFNTPSKQGSYNHATFPNFNSPNNKAPCTAPHCGSVQGTAQSSLAASNTASNSGSYAVNTNQNVGGSKCTTPGCDAQTKPEPCLSGNCGYADFNKTPFNTPSNQGSYNHATFPNFNSQNNKAPCSAPHCGSIQGTAQSSLSASNAASNSGSYALNTNQNVGGSKCTTPGCDAQTIPSYPTMGPPDYSPAKHPASSSFPHGGSSSGCGLANCGSFPSAPVHSGVGGVAAAGSYGGVKPNFDAYPKPAINQPVYSGGFGGPSGLLKPNEYSASSKPIFSQQKPASAPIHPTIIGSGANAPVHDSRPDDDDQPNFVALKPSNQNSGANHYGHNQAGSGTIAAAGASASVYTGGFGGPPGLLKPYDNGGNAISYSNKYNTNQQSGISNQGYGNQNGNIPSNVNQAGGAYVLTSAAAGAGALAGSSNGYHGNQPLPNHGSNNVGCTGGCNNGGGFGGGAGFGFGGSLGLSKTGLLDGLAGGLQAAGAAAKGIAGAVGSAGAGAGSFGLSGSFAGSAASAHASSGAATKGGYGRK